MQASQSPIEDAVGGDDQNAIKTSLETSLLVEISMPALQITESLNFKVKPSSQHKVLDCVEDLMHSISQDFTKSMLSVDKDSSERKMEHLRKRAMADMADWQAKLKLVDEWKIKVDRAATTMNRMRDAYFRELFHLREQVYQQNKAEKDGTQFQPSYALHFDPSEYHIDNEVQQLVADKVNLIQQEFETKIAEMDLKYSIRMNTLTESVKSTKIHLSRKEKLCKKLMDLNGMKDEKDVEERVGVVAVNEDQIAAKVQSKTDKEAQKAEEKALKNMNLQAKGALLMDGGQKNTSFWRV